LFQKPDKSHFTSALAINFLTQVMKISSLNANILILKTRFSKFLYKIEMKVVDMQGLQNKQKDE